jgi:isocitrate dehydrogenase
MPTPDVALSIRKITAGACERIARRSFELAMTRRKKVTAVHKANNFLVTDGLFLDQVRAVAKDSMPTSCQTWRASFPEVWGLRGPSMPTTSLSARRPSTAPRPTSKERTWQTPFP